MSTKNIKVSIIMPSFNVVKYIQECMDSVINQTLKDIEIIVVDANSTDGTYEILKEYEKRDSRVHILEDDKASTGYANNKAIDFAHGKYIGIVETDDYVRLDMFEKLYDIAERTGCEIVKGDYDSFSGDGGNRRFVKHHLVPADKYEKVIKTNDDSHIFEYVMFNWAGIYRRDFLVKNQIRHQETPGASFQDNGFFFLAYAYAENVYFTKDSFYRYRQDNPNSSINNPNKVFCMCDEYDYIERQLKKDPETWNKVRYGYLRRRYGACTWTLKKVKSDYRKELIDRLQSDFRRLIENDEEINKIQRLDEFKKEMYLLLHDKEAYYDLIFGKQNDYVNNKIKLVKKVKKYKNVLIFGCGERGTRLENLLYSEGINIDAFLDNNKSMKRTTWNNIKILSAEDGIKKYPQALYILTPQKGKESLKNNLINEGVNPSNIYIYYERRFIWD